MYFLYMMLCYLCIRPSASYVLLAANIDDFRTLAKRFAPDNMADQILAIHTDPKEKARHATSEETASSSETDKEKTTTKHKQKYAHRSSKVRSLASSNPSAYEFHLEDLVARVKERLQKELAIMATAKFSLKYTPEHYDEAATTEIATANAVDRAKLNQGQQTFGVKKPHTLKLKQHSDKLKHNEKDRHVGYERYIEPNIPDNYDPEAIPPPSMYLEHKKRIEPQPMPSRSQRIKNIRNNKRKIAKPKLTSEVTTEAETENILNLFEAVDMDGKDDSYEDYVTPKKDEKYEESPPSNTENTNGNFELVTAEIPTTSKADDLSEIEETINYNEKQSAEIVTEDVRTTRFNKQKGVIRLSRDKTKQQRHIKRQSAVKRLKQIQPLPVRTSQDLDQPLPYAEQIAIAPEYADEPRVIVTEDIKARTESIREEVGAIQLETIPYNITNPNLLNRHKNKKVQKAGTMIPKRDFYKMSSPNYVAKLPKVAEPYKFDEPIPEADREPEVLMPFANPPANINGKVKLS